LALHIVHIVGDTASSVKYPKFIWGGGTKKGQNRPELLCGFFFTKC